VAILTPNETISNSLRGYHHVIHYRRCTEALELMAWPTTTRHKRGYGTEWERIRIAILTRDSYLCQECLRHNRTTTATHVDHIKRKAIGGSDNEHNLQSLCKSCHERKSIEELGKTFKPKRKIGLDGFPIKN
jgi:5-methylcytosine-specific restriction endonuclease McrA